MGMKFGTNSIDKVYIGSTEIDKIYLGSNVVYEATPVPTEEYFLTFSSPSSFTLATVKTTKNWNGTLEYSTDKTTWATWDGTTTLSSVGNKLYLRGINNSYINTQSLANKGSWALTGTNISCIGNIENLLDYSTVALGNHPTMADYCYNCMFYACSSLTTAPSLPATTLSKYCYNGMFRYCSSLTTVPSLPATTLSEYCYRTMFYGCASIVNAPSLPATTLASNCYNSMFYGCTSLTTVPSLPATTLASNCYDSMFYGCTSLTTVPSLPATTLASNCYRDMFNRCYNIKLSTTQTGEYQNAYRIPTTGTGSVASYSLTSMFTNTGGTFAGTPSVNTTYYTSNEIV